MHPAAFRRGEDFKGSGLSLHVYPDGKVIPSRPEFPEYQVTAATAEEVGEENAQWLRPEFVAAWQAAYDVYETDEISGDKKGKGKGKAKSVSSKHTSSRQRHDVADAGSGGGHAQLAHPNQYSTEPDTGAWYRHANNGGVIYWDPTAQREYYFDEYGQIVWL